MVFTTADLFAGIGGIRIAFEKAGFRTVFANDFDPYCKITYDLNFSKVPLLIEDLAKVESKNLPDFDILLGGFPCQPFSIAGHRKGFNDLGRGNLFFEIVRILEDKRPRALLLENVKNLKTHDKGRTFIVIKKFLEDLGYKLHTHVLNSMEYGNIPQNRERIFIAGFLNDDDFKHFKFPQKKKLTVKISDILEEDVKPQYYYADKPIYNKLKDHIVSSDTVYQWRRQYVRENKKGVSPTLTANMGMGGHNVPIILDKKGIRKLTPRECARIQGFPDSYKFPEHIADSRIYKQIGNSVSVPVLYRIAKEMKKSMTHSLCS